MFLLQGVRWQIHPSSQGKVQGGTLIAGDEGCVGQNVLLNPRNRLLDPWASQSLSLLEESPSPIPRVRLMGRKRLFLRLGFPSNLRPEDAELRGEGRTLALP